jgi:1-acyl-sn-glycerol-3-phosphate acyltransferase
VRFFVRIYPGTVLHLKIYGKDKLINPPYILCSNHSSHLDGILLSSVIPHKIRWLITRKHFEKRKMRWMYIAMKLIPVNMEGIDSKAVRRSLDELKNKKILGIFPEGTRSMDGVIKKDVHSGAAYLAIKGGVPVCPAAIRGTFKALPPGASRIVKTPVSIKFGDPIFPPYELSKESVEYMSCTIMDNISRLFSELTE